MGKIRVMLVDDHTLVRQGIRRLLELEEDLEIVAEAGDGETAIQLAATFQPDVILMDIHLPRKSGLQATCEIKAVHPGIAVLALTAHDDDEHVAALLRAGAAGYLLKDIPSDDLFQAVRDVHAGESVLHPAIASRAVQNVAQDPRGQDFPDVTREIRDQDRARRAAALSAAELEVLRLAAKWMSNQEIAYELDYSTHVVQVCLTNIMSRLGVGSRIEAVIYALRKGWLPPDEREN